MNIGTNLPARVRLYLVADARAGDAARLDAICAAALVGGVTAVQLRAKGWSDRALHAAALTLAARCRAAGALFLINDRVDIALAVDADGVHLGVDDLPVAVARQLLGPHAIIGYSPAGEADRVDAEAASANYLGVGPVWTTRTKPDAGETIGLDGLARVVAASNVPVVAIGGVTVERARRALDVGAAGLAVSSAIVGAAHPREAARQLADAIGTGRP